jgi:large subunit ribosomal protein L3
MASRSTRRRGSRQFWPRVKAKKPTAVVGSWDSKLLPKETNFLGFFGYKVGMTSIGVVDNFSHTLTKGTEINVPVTILECPPIKVLSIRLLAKDDIDHLQVVKEVVGQVKDKNLKRKIDLPKKTTEIMTVEDLIKFANENVIEEIRIKTTTQPVLAKSIGQKKPHILELAVSGTIEEQIRFAYGKLGQEVKLSEVFKSGELVDSHGITKGFGFCGAVKRHGVKLTSHKSEKKRRHAGNVGAWTPSRVLTTPPMAGQHGFHKRCEFNKWIMKVSDKQDEINQKGGINRYGEIKCEYLLLKGSIQGSKRRLITLVRATRPNKRYPKIAPEITYINK